MFLAILRYLQSLGFVSVMETSMFQKAKAKAKKVKDTIRTKTGHGPDVDNTNQNDQEDEQMVEHSEVPDTGPSMMLSTSYITSILYISGLYYWFIVIPLCFETEKLIFFLNKVILEILVYVFPCYFHLLISDE